MKYKAIDPNIEVSGQTILDTINALGSLKDIGLSFLNENGLTNLNSKGWYPQQKLLDVFSYISEKSGGPESLSGVGSAVPENVKMPSNINDIHGALSMIDVAYRLNHRLNKKTEGNIGGYHYKFFGEREAEIVCDDPYPCDFDKALIFSMAKKFKPKDSISVKIEHDKNKSCREKGDSECHYIISW